ncbi:MAG: Smr/MutS family protein [Bacteroidales bacterium]|nr:Smr/MutS family protein [Bacteroidales bacterium]
MNRLWKKASRINEVTFFYLCTMIFPSNFEQKLGFDTIRKMLSERCLSTLGKYWVDKISFSSDAAEIETMLSETAEMKQVVQFEEHFPAQDYYDMIPDLTHVRIPESYLETDRLSELRLSLMTIKKLYHFLDTNVDKFPYLARVADHGSSLRHPSPISHLPSLIPASTSSPAPFPQGEGRIHSSVSNIDAILYKMDRILNDKSMIRDNASDELLRIRKEKIVKQTSVEREVLQCFKMAHRSGWIPDDAEITIRNGRLVIPLISTHKRKIPGFVHDESATGHTVYVEPTEIFETNNEIRELEYAEHREIIRILIEFANFLRPYTDFLIHAYQFLGEIDFIRSKAKFAVEVNGWKPMITGPQPSTSSPDLVSIPHLPSLIPASSALLWRGAVHPLLCLSHQKQNKPVVPLDIELNTNQRILIISGPNAGGKSVCLKTVGLLQYMFQCGLLPPVKEDSEFSVFSNIFIDIGDEQSIDNDLSTYTSKLLNLKFFLEHVDDHSLFLIDELGTGTDPSLGGAIAEATLESLNARQAFGVVTTHYSNLKLLASREPGIVNGAMLFDLKKLKPLYRLKTGKPGSSFALEIAHEIGFPAEALQKARKKTGKSQLDFDRELQNLEVEKEEITKKEDELKVADDFLAELVHKYEKLNADLETKKKEILEKARNEARQLLDDSNRIIEKTIKEIREAQAEKSKTKEAREELAKVKVEMMGDKGSEIKDNKTPISLPSSQISHSPSPISNPSAPVSKVKSPYQAYLNDLQQRSDQFSLTLDLRGKRVEEALPLLQRYIDDAILLSIHEVRILHGKGNGVLRQVTRDYLRSQKEVKSARDASLETGGAGITEVSFRG